MDNNPDRPTLISSYRSNEDIRSVLQEICARPMAIDGPERRRALAILDDLAEEMIGRSQQSDLDLKTHIQDQRVRWVDPVPPITDPLKP